MVRFRQVIYLGVVALLAASCSGNDDTAEPVSTTSTTAPASLTTIASDGDTPLATSAEPATTSSTTTTAVSELSFPQYRIVSRETTDDGDVVIVLLDPTSYESLSDLDIHNVMSDLVEEYAPIYEAYIVETQAAADALFVEDPTPEQETALDTGYLARLEEGFRIVYVGRLQEAGVAILGS